MLAALLVVAVADLALLPGGVTPVCDTVRYAMDMRTCFNLRDMGDYVMIHGKETIIETSLQVEGLLTDPSFVCQENETFSDLFDCLGGTTTRCISNEEDESYYPHTVLTKQGLEYFCQHLQDIDQPCYNETYRKAFDCVGKLSIENIKPSDSVATRACTTADITHDCIRAHMRCDEKTRDLLLKFQDEYRKPPSCKPPSRRNRKRFITVTGGSDAVLVSKFFCVFLSFFLVFMQAD